MKTRDKSKINKLFVLIKHFFIRFLNNDIIKYSSERRGHFIFAVTFFAFSGGIISRYLLKKYLEVARDVDPWHVETSFLTIMMVLMGIICVAIWDNIFLDKEDFFNLLILPVSTKKLFLAKFLSMLMFVGALTVLFVFTSILVFTVYLSPRLSVNPFYFGLVFFITSFLASMFIFLLLAIIQGIIIVLFSRKYLRKIFFYTQMLLIGGFLSVFIWYPKIYPHLFQFKEGSSSIYYFPPLWFAGLQNKLLSPGDAFFTKLMHTSIAAMVLLLVIYFLSMHVILGKSLRSSSLSKTRPKFLRLPFFFKDIFYNLVLRNPTQAAIYHFTIKTFRRNLKHKSQLALWMMIPLGLAITTTVFGYLGNKFKTIDSYLISPPVVLYIFLMPILKMVTRNPVEFEANWIFRMTEKQDKKHYLAGLKKALFFYAVFPIFILLFLFYCFSWGFEPALYHSFYGITIAWILMEAFFINYRNIPFTSKCLPYKANFVYSLMFYGFVFVVYNTLFTALGLFLLKNPVYYYFFYMAAFIILIVLKSYHRKTYKEFEFVYDEDTDPMFLSLDLDN
ncbi:MAG: ABC transporter permease [Candidatus Aminicenantes bacterium]|jgi:hypothetical protein